MSRKWPLKGNRIWAQSTSPQPVKVKGIDPALRAKAKAGDAKAQDELGTEYEFGRGVTTNFAKGAYWHRKAAEQGFAQGQEDLGEDYEAGVGVTQNYAKAVYWFRKAAEQGNAPAETELGIAYSEGHGVTQDYFQSASWFRKAAAQGASGLKAAIELLAFEVEREVASITCGRTPDPLH